MHEPDIDLETLRRSRPDRLGSEFAEVVSGITHVGWPSATASVLTCRRVRRRRGFFSNARRSVPLLTGFIVEFLYSVNGKTYTGVLESPVEVQPGDIFHIRYNPANPGENNTLGSTGDTGSRISTFITPVLVVLTVFAAVAQFLHYLRRFRP